MRSENEMNLMLKLVEVVTLLFILVTLAAGLGYWISIQVNYEQGFEAGYSVGSEEGFEDGYIKALEDKESNPFDVEV